MHRFAPRVLLVALTFTGLPHLVLAGTIKGQITRTAGVPFAGILVQAMDSDINPDDFMGDAITDSDGRYQIGYSNKRWDGLTGGGPDIYINAVGFNPTEPFYLQVIRRSKKYNNHNTNVTLTINLKLSGTVKGTITDKNDNPASNVRVKAMDNDPWGNPDDFMGKAMTNFAGNYSIDYQAKHWDSGTGWRPDIFIRVSAPVNGWCSGKKLDPDKKWIYRRDSSTTSNQKIRNDLTKNLKVSNLPLPSYDYSKLFVLGLNMHCGVDFPLHHSCFGCTPSGRKISWGSWGFTGVPEYEYGRCDFLPLPNCTKADYEKIKNISRAGDDSGG